MDHTLIERMAKYDEWVADGKIPTASKVIPVRESVTGLQWVLPTNQVLEILRNSRLFAITNCECRTKPRKALICLQCLPIF